VIWSQFSWLKVRYLIYTATLKNLFGVALAWIILKISISIQCSIFWITDTHTISKLWFYDKMGQHAFGNTVKPRVF